VFEASGRGTYYRKGAVCYRFSYTLESDLLTKTADATHSCGVGLTASYHVSVAGRILTQKHVGSGYESRWTKSGSF
jgi:hypothetical protein